jgi:hypothetical protein
VAARFPTSLGLASRVFRPSGAVGSTAVIPSRLLPEACLCHGARAQQGDCLLGTIVEEPLLTAKDLLLSLNAFLLSGYKSPHRTIVP